VVGHASCTCAWHVRAVFGVRCVGALLLMHPLIRSERVRAAQWALTEKCPPHEAPGCQPGQPSCDCIGHGANSMGGAGAKLAACCGWNGGGGPGGGGGGGVRGASSCSPSESDADSEEPDDGGSRGAPGTNLAAVGESLGVGVGEPVGDAVAEEVRDGLSLLCGSVALTLRRVGLKRTLGLLYGFGVSPEALKRWRLVPLTLTLTSPGFTQSMKGSVDNSSPREMRLFCSARSSSGSRAPLHVSDRYAQPR